MKVDMPTVSIEIEMCEKNSSRQASVRERYFHLGARDRKVRAALEAVGVVHEHNFGNRNKGYTSIIIW